MSSGGFKILHCKMNKKQYICLDIIRWWRVQADLDIVRGTIGFFRGNKLYVIMNNLIQLMIIGF